MPLCIVWGPIRPRFRWRVTLLHALNNPGRSQQLQRSERKASWTPSKRSWPLAGVSSIDTRSTPREVVPLFTDIHDKTNGVLYEAKADATRNSVRAGLGPLLDYRRYVTDKSCRLLLPARPSADLLDLLAEHDVATVWRHGDGSTFSISANGSTVAF